ncbi:MAG TPA: threonine synthase [Vicinamibacterales bacterium]|nr:threonine synthase [Vicinamibacterales bacterium]
MSTRAGARGSAIPDDAVGFREALLRGLAPDEGLYMPETIAPWSAGELAGLAGQTVVECGVSVLRPYVSDALPAAALVAAADAALNFPIPLVEIEPGLFALELFHGPTLAFKDVGARIMARLLAAVVRPGDRPITVLVATSGDTGGAVGHAFSGVAGTRVVILYPDGRVSRTQEAQLTAFNGVDGANVRAFAVSGSFDDCQQLVKRALADPRLQAQAGVTGANSINVGRLLPQMIYYFFAAAALARRGIARAAFSTPSGNFGNLTAGVMAKLAGAPIAHFVAATTINDVVPAYLETGLFQPRPSVATLANAMDCGNPSNFDRLHWLYGGDLRAIRADISGSVHTDAEVRAAIEWMDRERGYLLDPHSAIAYLGVATPPGLAGEADAAGTARVFLATAHPAKFAEVVEPIVGRRIAPPPALAEVLAGPRSILRLDAADAAIARTIVEWAGA